jgi:thiol-disulfide isomerase/thioredoxin
MTLSCCRLIALSLIVFLMGGCEGGNNPFTDKIAPDFALDSFKNTEKKKIKLSDFREETMVLLAFWATWCPPCVEEIPLLNQIQEKYASDKKLQVLSINVGEDRERIQSFEKEHPINYEILLDLDESVAKAYGISGLPVIVIVAKTGEILYYGFTMPNLADFLK